MAWQQVWCFSFPFPLRALFLNFEEIGCVQCLSSSVLHLCSQPVLSSPWIQSPGAAAGELHRSIQHSGGSVFHPLSLGAEKHKVAES